jgi:hypothetical protein
VLSESVVEGDLHYIGLNMQRTACVRSSGRPNLFAVKWVALLESTPPRGVQAPSPGIRAGGLQGGVYSSGSTQTRKVLLYVFAPFVRFLTIIIVDIG